MLPYGAVSLQYSSKMNLLVVFSLVLVAVSAAPHDAGRIVGGSVTNINTYPETAAMLYSATGNNHRQSCGGMIINNRSILTAAHCTRFNIVSRHRVRVGSSTANSGGIVYNVNRIIDHPNYNSRTVDNDISIYRTASTISFSNSIRAGSIAGANYNLADNQNVWVVGWGTTAENGFSSEQLRHVQVRTVNQNVCNQRYASLGRQITANMLCAGMLDQGGRDACQGDSGGPLFHNRINVGVVSWGNGCARPRYPGVYARTSRFTSWIQSNA